jgi:predicted metalloenzyme YecM
MNNRRTVILAVLAAYIAVLTFTALAQDVANLPYMNSKLSPEERVEEIARMLSGAAVTDEARAAARRLVLEAQAQNAPKKRARA